MRRHLTRRHRAWPRVALAPRTRARFSEQENLRFADGINEAGGQVFVDERVRRGGSHHQKLFVIRHHGDADSDVVFVGGIDLAHGRHDDALRNGDPQAIAINQRYGRSPRGVGPPASGGTGTGGRRPRAHVPRTLGGSVAPRTRALESQAGRLHGSARAPGVASSAGTGPPAGRHTRSSGAAHLCRQAPGIPLCRATRRTERRQGVHDGVRRRRGA